MAVRRRLCCGWLLLLLVLGGNLLLVSRLRGPGRLADSASEYLGKVRGGLRQLVSAPEATPADRSAPEADGGDSSAPGAVKGGSLKQGSTKDSGSPHGSAKESESAPVSAKKTDLMSGSEERVGSALEPAKRERSAPQSTNDGASAAKSVKWGESAPEAAKMDVAATKSAPRGIASAAGAAKRNDVASEMAKEDASPLGSTKAVGSANSGDSASQPEVVAPLNLNKQTNKQPVKGDGSPPVSAKRDISASDSARGGGWAPESKPAGDSVTVPSAGTADLAAGSDAAPHPAADVLDSSPPHLIIILSSSPRSGSSLLGEILSTSPNTAYFFEPFYYHIKQNISVSRLPAAEVQETLRLLLTCDLDRTPLLRTGHLRRFIWRPAMRPRVTPSTSLVRRHCEAATTRVVKLVRPRLRQLLPLLQDKELGSRIRLVHLVRDPRGTLNSQLHATNVWKRMTSKLSAYCDGVRADLAAARSLRDPRYQRVRYEELAQRPEEVAVRLYRGMQLPQPPLLHAYFQRHMNSSGPPAPRPPAVRSRAGWHGPPAPAERRSELPRGAHPGRVKRALPEAPKQQPLSLGRKEQQQQQPQRQPQLLQWLQERKHLSARKPLPQQRLQQQRQQQQQVRRKEKLQYYTTYRGPDFDPYHWRKELKPEVLRELEQSCADVIAELEAEVTGETVR